MVEKKIFLAIFLVILHNTSSDLSETENGLQRNVRRPSRGSYKYNHPPALEEYVPVAVVQEKVQIRTGKAIESEIKQNRVDKVEDKSATSSTTTTKATTTASEATPELQKEKVTTYRPPQAKNKDNVKEIKPKTASVDEIPVAVIYEEKIKPEEKYLTKESKKSLLVDSQEKKSQSSPTTIKKVTKVEKEPSSKTNEDNIASKEGDTKNNAKEVPELSDNSQGKKKIRERDPVVPIVDMQSYIYSHTGEFKYSYEGGDGTKAFETGELKIIDEENTGESVSGGFSYKDKDGNDFSLTYTADENGYRPVGAHLPTPPPIPPAIARALKYLATKTTPEPVTKSSKTSKETKEQDIKATTESVKAAKS